MLLGRSTPWSLARTIISLGTTLTLGAGALADATTLSFEPPPDAAKTPATPDPNQPVVCLPPPQADDAFHITVEPMAWYVGPSGKFSLPVNSGTGPAGYTTEGDKVKVNDLDLDSTRLRPAGILTVSTGRWRFSFNGSQYELSQAAAQAETSGRLGSVAFAQGDPLKLNFSFGTYELDAGYRIADYDFRPGCSSQDFVVDAYVLVHAFLGARIYDVDISAQSVGGNTPGARAEGSNVFAEPIIGVRGEAIFARDFSLVLQLSAGGLPLYSTQSYSFDISLAFQWRPIENVGIEIGWRQLAFDLTHGRNLDKFEYSGRLAGLFGGVTIRF
jgi:hypothetical protein